MPTKYKYFLKITKDNLTTRHGFKWKEKGLVKCKDWSDEAACGNGLHAFGPDKISLSSLPDYLSLSSAQYLAVKAPEKLCVNLNGKWKFPYCHVMSVNKDPFNILYYLRLASSDWRKPIILDGDGKCAINYYGQASASLFSVDYNLTHVLNVKRRCIIKYTGQQIIIIGANIMKVPGLLYGQSYLIDYFSDNQGNLQMKTIKISN